MNKLLMRAPTPNHRLLAQAEATLAQYSSEHVEKVVDIPYWIREESPHNLYPGDPTFPWRPNPYSGGPTLIRKPTSSWKTNPQKKGGIRRRDGFWFRKISELNDAAFPFTKDLVPWKPNPYSIGSTSTPEAQPLPCRPNPVLELGGPIPTPEAQLLPWSLSNSVENEKYVINE